MQSLTTGLVTCSFRNDMTKPFFIIPKGKPAFDLWALKKSGVARVPIDMEAKADAISNTSCNGGPCH